VGPNFKAPAAPQQRSYLPADLPAATASSDSPDGTAQRLVADPHYQMSIAEADALARDINAQLREFESGSPEAQYKTTTTSRAKAGLKRMDVALSKDINTRLRAVGQPGIEAYARRFAAISAFNKQVKTWMNPLERERLGLRTHEFVTSHGHGGISAGIKFFKENAGRDLADAFNTLHNAPRIYGPNSVANPPTMTPPPRQLPPGGTTQRAGGVAGGVPGNISPGMGPQWNPEMRGLRETGGAPGSRNTPPRVINVPGGAPSTAITKTPGTAPTTVLPSSGVVSTGSPMTPPPTVEAGPPALPAAAPPEPPPSPGPAVSP